MAELKPCPFCGSTDMYETYSQEYLGTKNPEIFCNSCKIIFSIEDDSPYMNCEEDYVYRKNKTLEAWNRRATNEPEPKKGHWVEIGDEPYDEWECDVCGFVIDGSGCIDPEEYRDVYRFCPNCGADMREGD